MTETRPAIEIIERPRHGSIRLTGLVKLAVPHTRQRNSVGNLSLAIWGWLYLRCTPDRDMTTSAKALGEVFGCTHKCAGEALGFLECAGLVSEKPWQAYRVLNLNLKAPETRRFFTFSKDGPVTTPVSLPRGAHGHDRVHITPRLLWGWFWELTSQGKNRVRLSRQAVSDAVCLRSDLCHAFTVLDALNLIRVKDGHYQRPNETFTLEMNSSVTHLMQVWDVQPWPAGKEVSKDEE